MQPALQLPHPFFVLAPMYDVTDTVFRQVIAGLARPDVFMTEFVNVDGLVHAGPAYAHKHLGLAPAEKPVIAQIWGSEPDNFRVAADDLVRRGFAGIDLNMGCPAKDIVKRGLCSGLICDRDKALEIIRATQEGAAGRVPVSVKTRLGLREIDYTWHELLLRQNLSMLTVHGRVTKQMSCGEANWEAICRVRELRDQLSPGTLMVGNGDVTSRQMGLELAQRFGLDGIMVGRGVFQDPFIFATDSPWDTYLPARRIALYIKHVQLFAETWPHGERPIEMLNKFCKIYINGFDGAKPLREQLMHTGSVLELLNRLEQAAGELSANRQ